MKPTLITCYVGPDLDGYAGVVAYAEFLRSRGRNVVAGIIGQPHDEIKYVLDRFGLSEAETIADDRLFNEVILVDASDINGLEGKIDPDKVIEIIDHRKVHEADKFPQAKAQIELVGAAATLVAEKFRAGDVAISRRSAILLYSAIVSNTLNFKGSVTTSRDVEAAGWLRRSIDVSDNYWRELFIAKSDLTGDKLARRIKGDFAWFDLGGKRVGIAQLEIIGAERLAKDRSEEILSVLRKLKLDFSLDWVFQSVIELELGKNYFISDDNQLRAVLEKILDVRFRGLIAERDKMIMRKQIVPLIKEELEKLDSN
jgi:inorganic pyrophosphatase/exopolyphosphatase